jgi:D-alanyl-lipoteichoic acid acyltransferase DltB (MBOAT superfamily)
MGFISYDFLIFFLVVFALYWLAPERRWQNLLLFAASAVFYGWLTRWHVLILLASIVGDYFLALSMERWKQRTSFLLWVGVILNLGFLASVKYYFSYDEILSTTMGRLGLSGDVFLSSIILPLGVSFYTLKKIGYLIDVKKGTLRPTRDFIAFAAYVSFFPQILSGPIERPSKLLKQLEVPRSWATSNFFNAWQLLLMGLFKKVVIANTIKVFVDQIFLIKEPSKVFLIVGGLGFTLQILADFSSYTDLSRSFAFLLGLNTTENFNKPYLSFTPSEFWNRWHISFSSWLRDYVFFPIRRILLRLPSLPEALIQALPPLITMFLSGLWHGTGATFIAWGLYYGILIVLYQMVGIRGDWKPANPVGRFLAWLTMFSFIVFGWIIFRAPSLPWLWNAFTITPFANNQEELIASFVLVMMITFYAVPLLLKLLFDQYFPEQKTVHALYYASVLLLTLVFANSSSPDFIYFQF